MKWIFTTEEHSHKRAEDFVRLLDHVGWPSRHERDVLYSWEQSLWMGFAYSEHIMVGSVRLVGDGYFSCAMYDLLVHPHHRRHGIATRLVREAMRHIQDVLHVGSAVCFAKEGAVSFYEAIGATPTRAYFITPDQQAP